MRQILILLLLVSTLLPVYATKHPFSPVIKHLNLKDGLSNNFVTDIAQDRWGFLWIATEAGLNRFDGENFRLFSERNTSLVSNAINSLFYDETTDKLWIGTKKGLNVLNCSTQKFESLELPVEEKSVNVVNFTRAADGGLYILNHYDYLLHYNNSNGTFKVYRQSDFPDLPMSFRSIADDRQGNLLIGHANYGFSMVNLQTKKVETFQNQIGNPKSLPGNNVKSLLIDRYNNIWIGTDHGLALFNPVTKEFTSLGENDSNTSSNIYSIKETKDGLLWIGRDTGGVSLLDIRDLSFSNPNRLKFTSLPTTGDRNGLSSANVHSVFQDSFGNMWIGNYSEGLDFISRMQPEFYLLPYVKTEGNRVKEKPVWSIYTDRAGNVWAGGENEVVKFKNGTIERIYNLSPYLRNNHGRIYAMAQMGDELLLSAFEDGLFSLNMTNGSIKRVEIPIERNYANSFYVLPNGRVLIGMQDGLSEYADGKVKRFDKLSSMFSNLIPNGIAVDRQGKLWIGTYGNGVFIFDKELQLKAHLHNANCLISNAVKQLYLDSRGWIWMAGQDGLSLIKDTEKPELTTNYDYGSGLEDIHIRAIQEDAEGNMWFSTNNRLNRWNKNTGKLENYDYQDGLPLSSFMDRAATSTADGTLYFGSLNGICTFKPEHFAKRESNVPVRIVECQSILTPKDLFDDNVMDYQDGGITIPYDMNSLRIVFSVPDYSQSRIVEYSYMIEGLDPDWIAAGREHEAILRNLAPGRYTFKVRACLRNQEWDDTNVAMLKIIVTPPLWLTWYAKVFYLLLTMAVIYLIIRFYKHRLLLKNSLELERRKSIDEQQLNNERLRFYTNITHELRTPLTLILGPLEDLVTDNDFPQNYKSRIQTIHSSALRLLNLINQILEFRKTETQNRRLTVAKSQIATLVTEIGLRYKELNHNEKVTINLQIEQNLPEIYFDSDIIHTILNNLLSNAVKYTPEGSILLSLKPVREEETDYVEIAVVDTGYGIDEKALPHIFDRYFQVEGKHQASGTGIGLALVRSLSDLHEGMLSVNSKVGKGTTFIFRLRADNTYPDALHKEDKAIPAEKAVEQEVKETTDKKPVVLVVEDNTDIRTYVESSLQPVYHMLTASNGEEGLELAKKHIPDVIISDIMMPIMDGMEMCKTIKEDINTSHIPVILLTAKDSIQDKETGYEIGADSYLTKPFSAKLLKSRIHNILESRKLLASILSSQMQGKATPVEPSVQEYTEAQIRKAESVPLRLSKLDEEFIQKFTRIVEDNMVMPELDMIFMQQSLNMSHSTLYRKIKGLVGMSGNEFIRKIRLKRGYELLREGCNVSEAAYSCGFNDVGYFRNCFKDEYGMSPSQFIKECREKDLGS